MTIGPNLIYPLNDSTNQPLEINFQWSPAIDATSYELQISQDIGFSNIVFDLQGISYTSRIVNNFDEGIEYYWRVNAATQYGVTDWSPIWSFTTEVLSIPNIVTPSGGIDYITDTSVQTLSGKAPHNTVQIKVNGSLEGVAYTSGDEIWAWTGTLSVGVNTIQVTAVVEVGGSFHAPRSLAKLIRRRVFAITLDQAFGQVMKGCAAPARGRRSTWITPEFVAAYTELHRQGHAHSLECWQGRQLAGGIYGVAIGGFFAGESMFHRVSNASKAALFHLIEHLRQRGFVLFDIQMLTPVTAQLGGITLRREEYLKRLAQAVAKPCSFLTQIPQLNLTQRAQRPPRQRQFKAQPPHPLSELVRIRKSASKSISASRPLRPLREPIAVFRLND